MHERAYIQHAHRSTPGWPFLITLNVWNVEVRYRVIEVADIFLQEQGPALVLTGGANEWASAGERAGLSMCTLAAR